MSQSLSRLILQNSRHYLNFLLGSQFSCSKLELQKSEQLSFSKRSIPCSCFPYSYRIDSHNLNSTRTAIHLILSLRIMLSETKSSSMSSSFRTSDFRTHQIFDIRQTQIVIKLAFLQLILQKHIYVCIIK